MGDTGRASGGGGFGSSFQKDVADTAISKGAALGTFADAKKSFEDRGSVKKEGANIITTSGRKIFVSKEDIRRMVELSKRGSGSDNANQYVVGGHRVKGKQVNSDVVKLSRSALVKAYNAAYGTSYKTWGKLSKNVRVKVGTKKIDEGGLVG